MDTHVSATSNPPQAPASAAVTTPTPAPGKAPSTAQPGAFEHLPLPLIALSQTPMQKARRERFDKARLQELAETIKGLGVLEPVLVRRQLAKSGQYELVAGERRYLASKLAGQETIPAIVRELSDLQVIEMQVIENNQREDLHELVEAEGFEQLINVHKLTVDAIAAKIGKSKSHVYGRLKLTRLCPEVRKAFYEGKIEATLALEIARHITPHDLQRQCLKEVTKLDWSKEPMSFRRAAEHIRQNYLVKLSAAPFDIKSETLVAKAGACTRCPKSSGNQPELFADAAGANVCTDPVCFGAKRTAHADTVRAAAIAKGQTVIAGAEAKKIAPNGTQHYLTGYHTLDAEHWTGEKHVKPRSVLGKDFQPTLLQDPKTGDLVPVVSNDQLRKALIAKGIHRADARQGAGGGSSKPSAAEKQRREQEQAAEKLDVEFRQRVFAQCAAKFSGPLTRDDLLRTCDAVDEGVYYDRDDFMMKTLPQPLDFTKLKDTELVRYIALLCMAPHLDPDSHEKPAALLAMAERFKIDHKAIRAAVEQELAPTQPAPPAAAAKKKAAAKAKPTAAAKKAPAKKKAAKK